MSVRFVGHLASVTEFLNVWKTHTSGVKSIMSVVVMVKGTHGSEFFFFRVVVDNTYIKVRLFSNKTIFAKTRCRPDLANGT